MNRAAPRRRRHPPLRFLCACFLAGLCLPDNAGLSAQVTPPPPPGVVSVSVTPADHCGASGLFAALAGHGYRDLWTTPVTVPVADLGQLWGSRPDSLWTGGGMTTQTLHVRVADGRRYVLRSVQKTTRQGLAEEFWGTPVEAIMRDQLCSFHPSGAVVVARLLDAVGVLHPDPQLLVIPDDPSLGDFREQFAGMLVLFEERPDERENNEPGFAGSNRVVQIENLFEDLEADPGDRVELNELLRARLIDVLVGDRDRSINNHLWARFDEPGGGHLWRPIPRDRDQAFIRFDGAAKWLGRYYDHRLVNFSDEYPDIEGLTRHAWDIDRNLLVGLEREEWDAIVQEVQDSITNEVIAEAVGRMPPEHYALVGRDIETSLRMRRDRLAEAADRMYEIIFRHADVHATDVDEVAVVEGMNDGRVRVAIQRGVPESEGRGTAHFERTFSPRETREIRIYMRGGDDRVQVKGSGESPIIVRVIGGGGRDMLANSGLGGVIFYDAGNGTEITGRGTKRVDRDAPRIYSWWVEGEGDLDWGTSSLPMPGLSYDKDRGLVLGFGLTQDRYGFLRQPFSTRVKASVGWAVNRSQPILDFRMYLQDRLGKGDLQFKSRYSGVEVLRYYGLGNETPETEGPAFYEVRQKQLILGADLSFGDGNRRSLSVGPLLRFTSSDASRAASFIAQTRPYGTGSFAQAGLRAALDVDGTDIRLAPQHGFRITGEATYYPEALDVESAFGAVRGEAAIYASPGSGNPTLALRAGGKKLWGTFPYSDAAFLGGTANVRGLREQRFAGDAIVYGNAELRVFLARFLLLFPTDFGVLGFTDTGRVFLDGESSDAWHSSWGGGVWFAPVTREATVQLSLAQHERTAFYLGLGFAF